LSDEGKKTGRKQKNDLIIFSASENSNILLTYLSISDKNKNDKFNSEISHIKNNYLFLHLVNF